MPTDVEQSGEPPEPKSKRRKVNARNKQPPKKMNHELRQEAVDGRDVLGLYNAICDAEPIEIDFQREFARLEQIVQSLAQEDPDALCDTLLRYGIGRISYLVLRVEYSLNYSILSTDRAFKYQRSAPQPQQVLDTFPALRQTYKDLAELQLIRASIARQRELARAKQLENDRAQQRIGRLAAVPGVRESHVQAAQHGHCPPETIRANPFAAA